MDQAVKIVCSKCGTPAAEGFSCPKCSGPLVKLCSACGHKNSLAKKYCDGCGTEFAARPATPAAPDAIIPETLIMRSPPAGTSGGFNLPEAGRSQQFFSTPPMTPAPTPTRPPTPSRPRGRNALAAALFPSGFAYFLRSVASILFLLALGACVLLVAIEQLGERSPKAVVKRFAERYLAIMAAGDYVDGYDTLSAGAKAACSIEDFRLLQETAAWSWSNARVAKLEPEAAVVAYDLQLPGKPPRTDFVSFVQENGRWVRPFNAGLLRQAQEGLSRGNADMADLKAQEAVRVNPRDPVARAYLCEASFARRQADAVERECGLALHAARDYPSDLPGPELYRIYSLLAQTLEGEGKPAQAVESYTAMLAFPGLSKDDACRIKLARGRDYQKLGQQAQAAADLAAASGCKER